MSIGIDYNGNGGPAFPVTEEGNHKTGPITYFGMSLRDWFAGKAFQSIIVDPTIHPDTTYAELAERAYSASDAMLARRKTPPEPQDNEPTQPPA